ERALGEGHGRLPVGLARHVEPDERGLAALGGDLRLHRAALLLQHVADDYLRALTREHLRLGRTHTARAAADERHLSREPHDRLPVAGSFIRSPRTAGLSADSPRLAAAARTTVSPGVLSYARIVRRKDTAMGNGSRASRVYVGVGSYTSGKR